MKFKNLLLQDHWANFNKTWVKKIQVYSNEGSHPFSRGDNSEYTLTIFFFKSQGQFQPDLEQSNLR